MQRERSQTISVFPITASYPSQHLLARQPPSIDSQHGSSVASSSLSPPPVPATHLIHIAPADSDSFRFLADLAEEPSSSILFPSRPSLHAAPPCMPDEHDSAHHRDGSLASQFDYVFGGPLNSLHSHQKSRTAAHLRPPHYHDENDPLAQHTVPAAIDACSLALSAPGSSEPAPMVVYPRYRGGPAKKKKKPLRQRIFSRRNKFVLLSSLVPLFSLVLVLLGAYTSRVRYPKIQKTTTHYVPVQDGYTWYHESPNDTLHDSDQYAYEIDYPVSPPEKFFNLYNPIIKVEGALLKPRNPATLSYQQRRFSNSRYTSRIAFRKSAEVGPLEPITHTTPSFRKEDPFFLYEASLAHVLYHFENVAYEDPYFVYKEEHDESGAAIP